MLINELVKLSGVSARTLRYYDEIGLLKPSNVGDNGYRYYSQEEIDRLQQILFCRALDFRLEEIEDLLNHPDYQVKDALLKQQILLQQKRANLDHLIDTIEKTLSAMEGEITMTNEQKFEAFKNELIKGNEQQFGKEIREKFGEELVMASYGKLKDMTEEQFEAMQQLELQLLKRLKEAMETKNASSDVAMETAELHKRWLSFHWAKYSKAAHIGLVQMYLNDERFISYYDSRVGEGATQFLHDAIITYSAI